MKIKINPDKSAEIDLDLEKYLLPLVKMLGLKAKDLLGLLNIFDKFKKIKKGKPSRAENYEEELETTKYLKKEGWLPKDDWEQIGNLDFNTFFDSHDKLTGRKHTLRTNAKWGTKKWLSELAVLEPEKKIYGKIKGDKIRASSKCNFVLFIEYLGVDGDRVVGMQESDFGFVQVLRKHKNDQWIPDANQTHILGLRLDSHHNVVARGFITEI